MLLKNVTVQNFRNIPLASIPFEGKRQFLLGPNGQGKTNLLEAIGYVTALRSFRTADHRLLIRHGESEAAIALGLEHEVMGTTPVRIAIRPEGREAAVDRERVGRLADIIGKFPVVVFSSGDRQFIRGAPGIRRRWIDLILAAADPEYLRLLQGFHRALAGRNRLLKSRASQEELGSFEAVLAPLAAGLYRKREPAIGCLNRFLSDHYRTISSGREAAELRFKPDVLSDAPDAFARIWSEGRLRDMQYGATQKGPHRDDYPLFLNENPSRDFASEGQQRGLMLALRLAQLDYFREKLRIVPVILADDIVNELDPERRERFWEAIGTETQLIATGTTPPGGNGWEIFKVEAGAFHPDPRK